MSNNSSHSHSTGDNNQKVEASREAGLRAVGSVASSDDEQSLSNAPPPEEANPEISATIDRDRLAAVDLVTAIQDDAEARREELEEEEETKTESSPLGVVSHEAHAPPKLVGAAEATNSARRPLLESPSQTQTLPVTTSSAEILGGSQSLPPTTTTTTTTTNATNPVGAFAVDGPGAYRQGDSNHSNSSRLVPLPRDRFGTASEGDNTSNSNTPTEEEEEEEETSRALEERSQLTVAAEVVPSVLELENQIEQRMTYNITQALMEEMQDPGSSRFTILRNAPVAQVISNDDKDEGRGQDDHPGSSSPSARGFHWSNSCSRLLLVVMILAVLIAFVSMGLALGLPGNNGEDGTRKGHDGIDGNETPDVAGPPATLTDATTNISTLEIVKNRGLVRCGVFWDDFSGYSFHNKTSGEWSGLNIDLCRVIAAAVLGNSSAIEPLKFPFAEWPFVLKNRTVDVVSGILTHTMGRNVWETQSMTGFAFAPPFLYAGLKFAGIPEYVDCAEVLDSFEGVCRDLRICMLQRSTHEENVAKLFPGAELLTFEGTEAMLEGFLFSRVCNVMTDTAITEELYIREQYNYTGPYKMGTRLFSRQALSFPTLGNDTAWSSLVNVANHILYTAEAYDLTQTTDEVDLPAALLNHDEFQSLVMDTIAAAGNMDQILGQAHLMERSGLNRLNTDSDRTGLIFSFPFGDLETRGTYSSGGMIDRILQRGFVRCGVTRRRGFVDFGNNACTGLDVEFCRALSAALFPRKDQGVEYVEIVNASDRFQALDHGDVDVLAGERVTLLNHWREPSTGKGVAYSPSYFYENVGDDSYALATRQDDSQFSGFVYWIVMSTFYAEEVLVSHDTAAEMPVVHLFGETLKRMFQDCIFEVGSYGDIYSRTLEPLIPRSGRNTLNTGGPQQFAFPFV